MLVILSSEYGITSNNGIMPMGSVEDGIYLVTQVSYANLMAETTSYEYTFKIKNIAQIELNFASPGEEGMYMKENLKFAYCFQKGNGIVKSSDWKYLTLNQLANSSIISCNDSNSGNNQGNYFLHIKFEVPQSINMVQGTYTGTLSLRAL